MTSPEAIYLLALLTDAGERDWLDRSGEGAPPRFLHLVKGDETIRFELRFSGGDPYYSLTKCPARLGGVLTAERIKPARRRPS